MRQCFRQDPQYYLPILHAGNDGAFLGGSIPASCSESMAVTSLTSSNTPSSFSNYAYSSTDQNKLNAMIAAPGRLTKLIAFKLKTGLIIISISAQLSCGIQSRLSAVKFELGIAVATGTAVSSCEITTSTQRSKNSGASLVAGSDTRPDLVVEHIPKQASPCASSFVTASAIEPSRPIPCGCAVRYLTVGQDIWSTYLNGGYQSLSGTSMATPFVTGAFAECFLAGYCKLGAAARTTNYPVVTGAAAQCGTSGLCGPSWGTSNYYGYLLNTRSWRV